MAELNPVHRYAVGALLGLALQQAQIHQCFSPSRADICTSEKQDGSTVTEFDENDTSLWSNYHSGLLRPIFRYLKIDSKAWTGIEQTALSTDAKSHIGAFLRILSEEEENTSAEKQLADAVDTVALTFEEDSPSGDSVLTKKPVQCGEDLKSATVEVSASDNSAECPETLQASMSFRSSEICEKESTGRPEKFGDKGADVKNLSCERNDSTSSKAPFMEEAQGSSQNGTNVSTSGLRRNLHGGIIGCTSGNVSKGLPGIRENYFGSSICENNPSVSEPSALYNELETSSSAQEDIELNGLREALNGPEDTDKDQNFSLIDSQISEGRLLTQQRKVALLYELLSASVADITPEKDEDELRLRKGYDSRHRVALRLLATWLDVKWTKMAAMEIMIAYSAMAAQEEREANKDSPESKAKTRAKWKRGGLIGAAALTGGALLALTGGLAAPAIAAGLTALAPTLGTIVPVIGSAGFAAAAAAAGSTAGSVAVAASFGAAGAGLTGSKMARRTGGVEEFGFEGIGESHQQGRLAVSIVVSGFVNDPEDFTKPWKGQNGDLERYALRWETKNLIAISTAIQDWLTSNISKELMKQGAMLTVLSTLLSALAWPAALLSLTDFIDSKWVVAVDRSDKAGKLLAEVLLKGLQGNRPVTLIGFSLGARVIFKCLEKLAEKGENGRIVERVVLLGAPISVETQRWETVRKVVAGRFVNAYSTNDWLLAVVYRASLLSQGLAGIQAVNIPGIENVDVTDVIKGHSSYLTRVGEILQAIDLDCYFPTCASKLIDSSTVECSQST